MKNMDVLKSQGIEVFVADGALRFTGPEGSKDIVAASMRERVHAMLLRAGHRKPQYRDASSLNVFDGRPGYGACELCGAKMRDHQAGTCVFCVEVVKRALKLDEDARLVAIDTETTGLDPNNHGVIEVACKVMDRACTEVIDSFEAKLPIRNEFVVDDRALEINGYTHEKWASAVPHADAFARIAGMIRPQDIVIGWNLSFDVNMLRGTALMLGLTPIPLMRCVDAKKVLSPLLRGKTENMKLTTVTSYLGIDHSNAHSAMGDVDPLIDVWKWMLNHGGGA